MEATKFGKSETGPCKQLQETKLEDDYSDYSQKLVTGS